MHRYRHVLGWVFLAVAAVLAAGLLLPREWTAEASVTIRSTPEAVYPHLVRPKAWKDWAIWFEHDPNISVTWTGPAQGAGAGYEWSGNVSVGEGRLVLLDADPPASVDLELSMDQDRFQSRGQIAIRPVPEGAEVVWRQQGDLGQDVFARFQRTLLERSVSATLQDSLERLRDAVERAAGSPSVPPSGGS